MVQRHEGVYDGRYKLMNFYDIGEWELYDMKSDPQEMQNQYRNPDFTVNRTRLHRELDALRTLYDLPANEKQDLSKVDMRHHSDNLRKQGIARKKVTDAKKAK